MHSPSKLTCFHIFALPLSVAECLLCLSGVSVDGNCLLLVVSVGCSVLTVDCWMLLSVVVAGSRLSDVSCLVLTVDCCCKLHFSIVGLGTKLCYQVRNSSSRASVKGTVRPDWICMRVVPLESPLKGHQPLYGLDFLISVLNI